MLRDKLSFVICLIQFFSFGQLGITSQFSGLTQPVSARQASLGGSFITQRDNDLSSILANPALLNTTNENKIVLNSVFIPSGAAAGSLQYSFKKNNYFFSSSHLRFLTAGGLNRTGIDGTQEGKFNASEYILGYSIGYSINERFTFGSTLNLLYGQLESYNALGTSVDIGGHYTDPTRRIDIGGTIKNLGIIFNHYTETKNYSLPIQVQLAISHKLAHAPFRFTVLANNLQKWDLTYYDSTQAEKKDALTGEITTKEAPGFLQKLSRHFVLQTELLLGEKLHLRFGFDYNRRVNLRLIERGGLSGFSMGLGAKFKRFSIDYGFLVYSVAGSQQYFTLSVPLNKK